MPGLISPFSLCFPVFTAPTWVLVLLVLITGTFPHIRIPMVCEWSACFVHGHPWQEVCKAPPVTEWRADRTRERGQAYRREPTYNTATQTQVTRSHAQSLTSPWDGLWTARRAASLSAWCLPSIASQAPGQPAVLPEGGCRSSASSPPPAGCQASTPRGFPRARTAELWRT